VLMLMIVQKDREHAKPHTNSKTRNVTAYLAP
jgi:hypothetical protein